VGNSSALA
jgi:predicted aspartyl protease